MKKSSIRISLGYFVVASLWIVLSEQLIYANIDFVRQYDIWDVSVSKGLFFVSVTTIMLFLGIKKSEKRLEDRARVFERLYRDNPNPMLIYNPIDLTILGANHAAEKLYKRSEVQLIKIGMAGIQSREELDRLREETDKLTADYKYSRGWRHAKSDGTEIIVNIASYPAEYKGKKTRVLTITDVSEVEKHRQELMRVNRELHEEKERQFALMNSIDDVIWSMREDFTLISANRSFMQFYSNQYDETPIIGRPLSALRKDWSVTIPAWGRFVKELMGKGQTQEFIHKLPDSEVFQSIRAYAIPKPDTGEIAAIGVICRDITSLMHNRQQLESQNQQLLKIASVFSHELRRPVSTVIGLIDLIENPPDDQSREEAIAHLKTVSDEIDGAIRKIVERTRILNHS